jgi:hypothetical protein
MENTRDEEGDMPSLVARKWKIRAARKGVTLPRRLKIKNTRDPPRRAYSPFSSDEEGDIPSLIARKWKICAARKDDTLPRHLKIKNEEGVTLLVARKWRIHATRRVTCPASSRIRRVL